VTERISRCAQSLHALKVLRCHGMTDDALMIILKSVVIAKILQSPHIVEESVVGHII